MCNEAVKRNMSDYELVNISGGAIKWAVVGFFVGIGAFIAGVVDGYLRPFRCR